MYTPLNNLTLDELLNKVLDDDNASWTELELVNRIRLLEEQIEDMRNDKESGGKGAV